MVEATLTSKSNKENHSSNNKADVSEDDVVVSTLTIYEKLSLESSFVIDESNQEHVH